MTEIRKHVATGSDLAKKIDATIADIETTKDSPTIGGSEGFYRKSIRKWGCCEQQEERHAMRKKVQIMKCMIIAVVVGLMSGIASQAVAKPLKVFILAGQSNMQGHANISTFVSHGR